MFLEVVWTEALYKFKKYNLNRKRLWIIYFLSDFSSSDCRRLLWEFKFSLKSESYNPGNKYRKQIPHDWSFNWFILSDASLCRHLIFYMYRVSQKKRMILFFGNNSTLERGRKKSRGCFENFWKFSMW